MSWLKGIFGGGSRTKLSAKSSEEIVNQLVLSQTASCSRLLSGDQQIECSGARCDVSGNTMRQTLVMDAKCVLEQAQSADIANTAAASIEQFLKETSTAGLQWMDTSGRSVATAIASDVRNAIDAKQMSACAAALNGRQVITVRGDDGRATNNALEQELRLHADCFIKQVQGTKLANHITNAVNQRAEYTAKNPLAFIGDALAPLFTPSNLFVILLVLAVVVGGYLYIRSGGSSDSGRVVVVQSAPR